MNVGMLFPSSNAHPALGLDFIAGLKTFFIKQAIDKEINLLTESIAFGGAEKEVYAKAEKLLIVDDVDILLAFIDERTLTILKPLLYATGKLMIVINAGANYPLNWVPQANIVHLTLQHAFCNWLTGSLAAEKAGKNAATISTFYDCGYLHTASIVKAFEKNGGTVMFNFVNQDKYDESFAVAPLTDFLAANETTQILCTLDSLPASLFYAVMNKAEVGKDLQLFVSPMMLEQKALINIGDGFSFSIGGHTPWNISAENEGNKIFIETCRENKKNATIFSLLGWETAMIVTHIFKQAPDDYSNGAALVDGLKTVQFDSPRGGLELDEETNFFLAPVYKCTIAPHTSLIKTTVVDEYKSEWKNFVEEPTGGVISGWTNTYLCY